MSASAIKQAIKANLDALVTSEVLAAAETSDLRKDPLGGEIPGFPYAVLMPPSIESDVTDNRTNVRTYTYEIMVLWKADDIEDATTVEADIEAILDIFDNDPTLGGTAMAGMQPVSLAPEPFQHASRDLIGASVMIKAKQFVQLTY